MERGCKNTLFVVAAIAASLTVPIPQTACSTISCGFAAPLHDCKLLFDEIIYNEDVVNILQYNLNIKKSVVIVTTNCYNTNAYFYA